LNPYLANDLSFHRRCPALGVLGALPGAGIFRKERWVIRCLTIKQPWAWAISVGIKIYENRVWSTSYRGPLLIHAGKGRDVLSPGSYFPDGTKEPTGRELVFGAIIAVAQLVECWAVEKIPKSKQHWSAEGPFCFELRRVQRLDPFPCSGLLGLWLPPKGFHL
jgi:hypothetical protein